MLDNAKLHTSELQTLFYKIWYDPKYQYYFGSDYRWSYSQFDNGDGDSARHREFVSLDKDGNVIGYVGYMINPQLRFAYNFGAINFTDGNKFTFAKDLRQVIDDIFVKFGMETLEFSVICGNPVEKSYDRVVKRAGGRILCQRHARAQDLSGNLCDDKLYEITMQDYFNAHHKEV